MEADCKKAEVLEKVKANQAGHAKIVEEARTGFVAKAKQLLEEKLALVKEGKVTSLRVNLDAPLDYTSEYSTVIKLLEMHQEDTITLSADEIRMFIEDKWDWTEQFLGANSAYSGTAAQRYGNR